MIDEKKRSETAIGEPASPGEETVRPTNSPRTRGGTSSP